VELRKEHRNDINTMVRRLFKEWKGGKREVTEGKEAKGIQTKMDPETMEVDKAMEEKGIQVQMDPEIKEIERIVIKEVERKVQRKERSVQTEEGETTIYTKKELGNQELGRKMDEVLRRVKALEKRSSLIHEDEWDLDNEERTQESATWATMARKKGKVKEKIESLIAIADVKTQQKGRIVVRIKKRI